MKCLLGFRHIQVVIVKEQSFTQTYPAELVARNQQTRKHRPAQPSQVNDLSAPRPTRADEDEWETINHMTLTNHMCDMMQLFRLE